MPPSGTRRAGSGEEARASSSFFVVRYFLLARFRRDGIENSGRRVAHQKQRHQGEQDGKQEDQEKKALARGLLGLVLGGNDAFSNGWDVAHGLSGGWNRVVSGYRPSG